MQDYPLIAVIILNTNRKEDTLACLTSLIANQYPRLKIVVLDNHSTDGSVEAIQAQFPQVTILAIDENKGYAGNNNVGLKFVQQFEAEWIFVVNEDTIFADHALQEMMIAVANHPEAGIIGPLVYHFDEPTIIQSAGGKFNTAGDSVHISQNEEDRGQFQKPYPVDWISGCAIAIRKEALQQAGLIDERFFYYWEETEWCYRVKSYGWEIFLIPAAKIWHKGVQRNYVPNANITYYATRNRLLFYKIHHFPLRIWLSSGLYFGRTLLSLSVRPKWRYKHENRDAMWQGICDFIQQNWGKRNLPIPNSAQKEAFK